MLDFETEQYKTHLESITSRELIKMAEHAGIDIPPDLDRIFIIRELLDLALEEKAALEQLSEKPDIPPELTNRKKEGQGSSLALKTAALPEQYHITYIEVLCRDPQWIYVFWEIKAQDRERFELDPHFEGYALKVLENKLENNINGDYTESFTVPVGREDNSWYINFPEPGTFRIALWLRGLNSSLMLSRPFVLPRFIDSPGNEEYFTLPLIKLSNIPGFTVLRAADRIPQSRS